MLQFKFPFIIFLRQEIHLSPVSGDDSGYGEKLFSSWRQFSHPTVSIVCRSDGRTQQPRARQLPHMRNVIRIFFGIISDTREGK